MSERLCVTSIATDSHPVVGQLKFGDPGGRMGAVGTSKDLARESCVVAPGTLGTIIRKTSIRLPHMWDRNGVRLTEFGVRPRVRQNTEHDDVDRIGTQCPRKR